MSQTFSNFGDYRDAVKGQVDFLALAREVIPNLKGTGGKYRGDCPCCGADDGALQVELGGEPHTYCHARCNERGDVFNLWNLRTHQTWATPKGKEFVDLVNEIAQSVGMEVYVTPRQQGRDRTAGDRFRDQMTEARNAAHGWLRDQLLGDAGTDARALIADYGIEAERLPMLGFLPSDGGEALTTHLSALGLPPTVLAAAGLDRHALASFQTGIVLLRVEGNTPAGLSQHQADGSWVHAQPDTRRPLRLAPPMLTPIPRSAKDAAKGTKHERILVIVPDVEAALACVSAIDAVLAHPEHPAYKVARTVSVVAAGEADPMDAETLGSYSARSLVLMATPDIPPRQILAHGNHLTGQGVALRVAEWPSTEDGLSGINVLRAAAQSREFVRWQWETLTTNGVTPGSEHAHRWVSNRVEPMAQRVGTGDPLAAAVYRHRASRMATGGAVVPASSRLG